MMNNICAKLGGHIWYNNWNKEGGRIRPPPGI